MAVEDVGGIMIDFGTCTCRRSVLWCWGCGHDASGCSHSCLRRGFHGWCRPEENATQRAALGYAEEES